MRPLLSPPPDRTYHFFGDIHHFGNYNYLTQRTFNIIEDLKDGVVPTPVARLACGDLVDDGDASSDTRYLAWEAQLPVSQSGGGIDTASGGNHDVGTGSNDLRSMATALAALNITGGRNHIVDYPHFRLIVVSPTDHTSTLPSDSLTFLADSLASTDKDCAILCHFPLYDSVLATDPANVPSSITASPVAYAEPKTTINGILAAAPNACAWLSGHTHSWLDQPGIVRMVNVGGQKQVIAINLGSIYYINPHDSDTGSGTTPRAWYTNNTVYLTWYSGSKLEVRWRNHTARRWTGPRGYAICTAFFDDISADTTAQFEMDPSFKRSGGNAVLASTSPVIWNLRDAVKATETTTSAGGIITVTNPSLISQLRGMVDRGEMIEH